MPLVYLTKDVGMKKELISSMSTMNGNIYEFGHRRCCSTQAISVSTLGKGNSGDPDFLVHSNRAKYATAISKLDDFLIQIADDEKDIFKLTSTRTSYILNKLSYY